MEGQGAEAQRVINNTFVNTPADDYAIIFRDDSDGLYYGKLSDGTIEFIGGGGVGAGDWKFNGNVVVSEKFIGTLDAFDFPIRTNNVEVARFTVGGNLRLAGQIEDSAGLLTILPTLRILVDSSGAVDSLNWGSRILVDSTSLSVLDWTNTATQGIGFINVGSAFTGFIKNTLLTANRTYQLPNSSGTLALTSDINSSSGTYTPVATAVANVDVTAGILSRWVRIGNQVFVSGAFTIDATTTLVVTTITLSVPVATANFPNTTLAAGVFSSILNTGASGRISATSGAQTVTCTLTPTNVGSATYGFNFSYTIQ